MPHLVNSPLPTKKVKITLKMKELTTEQQMQEFLVVKQQEAAEENKRKKREYTFYLWITPIISALFAGFAALFKFLQIRDKHRVNNYKILPIVKSFFIFSFPNFAFYGLLSVSLLLLWGFLVFKRELKKLNQPENTV